jgi:hypothetical protein
MFAQHGPPPVTVQGDVSIKGTVAVQGIVETINDVLRVPFATTVTATFAGAVSRANFDVPTGKRLIVELLSVQVIQDAQNVQVDLRTKDQAGDVETPLAVPMLQSTGAPGTIYTHSLNLPATLRIDYRPNTTNELSVQVIKGTGGSLTIGQLKVSVRGYLVDIP